MWPHDWLLQPVLARDGFEGSKGDVMDPVDKGFLIGFWIILLFASVIFLLS